MTNVHGDQAPAKIREFVVKDSRRTICELADSDGISYGDCQEILTESFEHAPHCMEFVPQILTNEEVKWHLNVCL
jgi:hypothetical protein